MKYNKIKEVIALSLLVCSLCACWEKRDIRFLQLNIWQEGKMVDGGYEALVNEIARADADFVMLSEVRNYKDTRFCDRIVASLKEKGKTYYSFFSDDSGLLSKYPLLDSAMIFPLNGDHGSVHKLVADIDGREVAVYTAHLDYLNCAYYDVRGYDGNSWQPLDTPLTDRDSVLRKNVASQRDDAIRAFLADAAVERGKGRFVFIGGDFNEPSHRDWTEATKDSADHHGMVIPWTVTTLLEDDGFLDAYRTYFPNPVKNPGYTFPADTKSADIKKLLWAPNADERERIDYIFYAQAEGLALTRVFIYGPKGSIRSGLRMEEHTSDVFVEPCGLWPTDHKGLIAEFRFD
ncbi:MAG: endonuclease/exonuclease/phosphatase family protein [Odoribacter sp.]